MFQLRNAVTKRSALGDAALTAQIESEVRDDMHARYSTCFCLDDELLVAQLVGNNKKNSNSQGQAMSQASLRTQSAKHVHPVAPWGLLLAWTMVAAIFSSLFVLACLGGLDLG